MMITEIYFRVYPNERVEKSLHILKSKKPNFLCRVKEQELISEFPALFIQDYIQSTNLTPYHIGRDIYIWSLPFNSNLEVVPDVLILKPDGDFDSIYGDCVITGKRVNGQVLPLTNEQCDYLIDRLLFGDANGKIAMAFELEAKGVN